MNIKKKLLISLVSVLGVLALVYCYYYFNKIKPYNVALKNASNAVIKEEYDIAIESYMKALGYKKNIDLTKEINLAKLLKKSKENYNLAIKQMNDKKYLQAIETLRGVDKQDGKRYLNAQNKITECTNTYIRDNLDMANERLKNNKFNDANKCLEDILKLDSNNSDAKKLKKHIQEVKDENEEKEKYKKLQEAKGIKSLGELRRKFFHGKYVILGKDIPDVPTRTFKELHEKYGYKYDKYLDEDICFVHVGTGKWEDLDDKLVEPDVIINGQLAYTVNVIPLYVYFGGGNGYNWCIVGMDGKHYGFDEAREAVENNRASYRDGTKLNINGHYTY